MAVTITADEAAVAIRAATSPMNIPAPVQETLRWIYPAAVAIVVEYAPLAPDAVHDAALIRLLGWLWEADPNDSRVGRALNVSGAAPLLGQWRQHRAGIIGAAEAAPAPAPSELPDVNPTGNFILTTQNGELVWVAFPLP